MVYSLSFVPGDSTTADAYGHGTHVAGLVGGNGDDSSGWASSYVIRGLAPNVKLINLRVLDGNGNGSDSGVIAAIQKAISLKSKYNIRVINLSLGRPVASSYTIDPLCQAVESAWKAGIVVVVAAGNQGRNNSAGTNGYGTITAPGNDPYVITVGAMNTEGTLGRADDKMTTYSSKGPTLFDHVVKPDLVAPGNRMFSSPGSGKHAGSGISSQHSLIPEQLDAGISKLLLSAQRHQYGDPHGQRHGGFDAAAESQPDAGSGEGYSDDDGHQDLPGRHVSGGPDLYISGADDDNRHGCGHRRYLYDLL